MNGNKDRAAHTRLMQYLVAHTHDGVPTSEQSERAMRAVSGRLGRNPPFVESTRTFDDPSIEIASVAISPKGRMAVVLKRDAGEPRAKRLSLVTYEHGAFSMPRPLGSFREDAFVYVLFPKESDEPAVFVDGSRLFWDTWCMDPAACLPTGLVHGRICLWGLWRTDKTQHALFLSDSGMWRVDHRIGEDGNTCTSVASGHVLGSRWIGGDSFVVIEAVSEECQVLIWHDRDRRVRVEIPSRSVLYPELIGAQGNGIQFVVYSRFTHTSTAFWTDGSTPLVAEVPGGELSCVDGRIFVTRNTRGLGTSLLEFREGQFVHVATTNPAYPMHDAQVLPVGDNGYVLMSATAAPVLLIEGKDSSEILGDAGISCLRHVHGGIAGLLGRTYVWRSLSGNSSRTFPFYGIPHDPPRAYVVPYDRLTPIEDARGKAVMSYDFVDGTFHVLYYPLPSPR